LNNSSRLFPFDMYDEHVKMMEFGPWLLVTAALDCVRGTGSGNAWATFLGGGPEKPRSLGR
jgi:hypothetical protein